LSADRIAVARLIRPRGVKGELIADAAGWTPDQIAGLRNVYLDPPGRPVEIESAWSHQDRLVVKLRGVDSMTDAELLRNADLSVARPDLPATAEDEYYFTDLIGCQVVDQGSGSPLGVVTGCLQTNGPMLLEVKRGSEEFLIPLVKAICGRVDVAARQITVDLPEGLIESQRP